jgi:hypothetical protein
MILAASCVTWAFTVSNEFFADEISKPSTSAAIVAIRPVVNWTTRIESSSRWCAGSKGAQVQTEQCAAEDTGKYDQGDAQMVHRSLSRRRRTTAKRLTRHTTGQRLARAVVATRRLSPLQAPAVAELRALHKQLALASFHVADRGGALRSDNSLLREVDVDEIRCAQD